MKNFKKIKYKISKIAVVGSIGLLSFLLTGCQQVQEVNNIKNTKESSVTPKQSLFFFGNDKVENNNNNKVGVVLENIKNFVKIELETTIPDRLYKGVKFPLSLKVLNFNYIKPSEIGGSSINEGWLGGTGIDDNQITITYSIGGSSDLNIKGNSNKQFKISLAQFINGRVIPLYSYLNLGTVSFDENQHIGTLTKKYIEVNVCYPVLKKDEFTLTIPASTKSGSDAYINKHITPTPNNGEIVYSIDAQGMPIGNGNTQYKYNLIITINKNLGRNRKIAVEGMNNCGPVPSVSSGKYPVVYLKLVGRGAKIKCNFPENPTQSGEGKVLFYQDGVTLTCEITYNKREQSDKEVPLAIYSAYTIVKTIKSNEFNIEG